MGEERKKQGKGEAERGRRIREDGMIIVRDEERGDVRGVWKWKELGEAERGRSRDGRRGGGEGRGRKEFFKYNTKMDSKIDRIRI